jgi:uncharacterized protein (TIGR02391 family)
MDSTQPQGKSFHSDIAVLVVDRFKQGFLDEAVLNAYKVVEEKLRAVTGSYEADGMELIRLAFHPNTGLLADFRLLPAEKEGFHQLVRGAFLTYRNSSAHRFRFSDYEEAFDAVVLANRIYLTIEANYRNRAMLINAFHNSSYITYPTKAATNNSFLLDIDNDGEDEEIIIGNGSAGLTVYFKRSAANILVDQIYFSGEAVDMLMADIDNDGAKELVCLVDFTAGSRLICYRYTAKGLVDLQAFDDTTGTVSQSQFVDAQLTDYDGDGKIEVISEPWDEIPIELWPSDRPYDINSWGRVRYVYRWNSLRRNFGLVHRELFYIGGR